MPGPKLLLDFSASAAAAVWRRVMHGTKLIAITGSCGKTTAAHCLGAILSAHAPTNWRLGGHNSRCALAMNILRTRRHHRYTILEVGTKLPGALWRASWVLDPDVAVVLQVKSVHTNSFADLDAIAAEKAQLLGRLRGSKIAILNGDDPRVRAMRQGRRCRVLTFGRSTDNDLWASDIRARWPSRLWFRAHWADESFGVKTTLVGEHWLPSVLGAMLAALALGVPLADASTALERVQIPVGRMQPAELPSGVTFLRDDFNMSLSTMEPALDVLRTADVKRRVAVIGDVFDSPLKERPRLEELGRQTATAADLAVFIGKNMRYAARAAEQAGMRQGTAVALRDLFEAAEFCRQELSPGDLVLLRSDSDGHFERLYFAQSRPVACSKRRCRLKQPCDSCDELYPRWPGSPLEVSDPRNS